MQAHSCQTQDFGTVGVNLGVEDGHAQGNNPKIDDDDDDEDDDDDDDDQCEPASCHHHQPMLLGFD